MIRTWWKCGDRGMRIRYAYGDEMVGKLDDRKLSPFIIHQLISGIIDIDFATLRNCGDLTVVVRKTAHLCRNSLLPRLYAQY